MDEHDSFSSEHWVGLHVFTRNQHLWVSLFSHPFPKVPCVKSRRNLLRLRRPVTGQYHSFQKQSSIYFKV